VLENRECTPRSDLCSLGYVLIEMLAGCSPVAGVNDLRQLLEVRRSLSARAARGAHSRIGAPPRPNVRACDA
jgi:serine/threonine-protein kinase